MTNQFTDEQIEAGGKALFDRDNPGREHALLAYEEVRGEYEAEARAALEAAAGVAPHHDCPGSRECCNCGETCKLGAVLCADCDSTGETCGVAPQAPSGERAQRAREAQKAVWAEIHGQPAQRTYSVAEVKKLVYSLDNAIADAFATPVQPSSTVDIEKLAGVLRAHEPRLDQTACYDGWCICGWTGDEIEHSVHQARAVVEVIGGEGRDIAGEIEAERLDTDHDALGADAYINGLSRAEEIARNGR